MFCNLSSSFQIFPELQEIASDLSLYKQTFWGVVVCSVIWSTFMMLRFSSSDHPEIASSFPQKSARIALIALVFCSYIYLCIYWFIYYLFMHTCYVMIYNDVYIYVMRMYILCALKKATVTRIYIYTYIQIHNVHIYIYIWLYAYINIIKYMYIYIYTPQPLAAPPRSRNWTKWLFIWILTSQTMTTLVASGYQKYWSSLTSHDHQLEMVPSLSKPIHHN